MGDLVWDDRLISRDEAWRLAGPRPVRPGIRSRLLFADCGECGQAILPLGTARLPFTTTLDQLRDAVLRHAVSAHSMALNHRREPHGGDQPGAAGGGAVDGTPAARSVGVRGDSGAAAARRRHPSQAAGRPRGAGAAGGDRE